MKNFRRAATIPEAISQFHELERQLLAPYAMPTAQSAGRRHLEPEHPYRPAYVRDRDRIIHSAAFRRMAYKTQVFASQPNDHHRTRLTHTLEVVQIARTVARNLRLNEDLTEAVALAHDLGHPPFGHAGERVLDELLEPQGGFEHNRQGLRLLEVLESRYPSFSGLNLTYEVLESVALHSKRPSAPEVQAFQPGRRMLAEYQVVDLADSIAYSTHDIDDALRQQLITFADLDSVELWRIARDRAKASYGPLEGKNLTRAVIRCLIDHQVGGMISESHALLAPITAHAQVRTAQRNLVDLPESLRSLKRELQGFLFERVYRHASVIRVTREGEEKLRRLFEKVRDRPELLPEKYARRLGEEPLERCIADYLASMTDRYAAKMYEQLA